MHLNTTTIIIIITAIVSIGGFSSPKIIDDLIFYPPAVTQRKQWYRFITCGFIHADYGHLIFNMLSLYFFGDNVETIFKLLFNGSGTLLYILLYISALVVSLLPTYFKHKNSYHYRSLGASGAVSAVIFAGLVLVPSSEVFIFFIPIPIPGFIFAPLYLLISFWMDRKGNDSINHSAHIWGSIYGAVFVIVACLSIGFPVLQSFIDQVKNYMQVKGWTH
jgi:membrane associated rhomboid family serine protease